MVGPLLVLCCHAPNHVGCSHQKLVSELRENLRWRRRRELTLGTLSNSLRHPLDGLCHCKWSLCSTCSTRGATLGWCEIACGAGQVACVGVCRMELHLRVHPRRPAGHGRCRPWTPRLLFQSFGAFVRLCLHGCQQFPARQDPSVHGQQVQDRSYDRRLLRDQRQRGLHCSARAQA